MLLQVKGLIQIIAKFRTEKKNICACFYHPHETNIMNVMGHAQNIVHQIFCTAVTLKRNELTVYISLKATNWHFLQIAKTQFRYTI